MNDDFLYENRPPVREEFAEGLYRRLCALDERKRRPGRLSAPLVWRLGFAALCLTVLGFFTFSEPVRASVLAWVRTIAGFTLEEHRISPAQNFPSGEAMLRTQGAAVLPEATPSETPATEAVQVYDVPTLSLNELRRNAPFTFGMPVWAPEGFTLQENIAVANSGSWVSVTWTDGKGAEIEMLVEKDYTGNALPVGEGAAEEIRIGERTGFLVRGFWDADHHWDIRRGIVIGWMQNERFYRLQYFEREPEHNSIRPIQGDLDERIAALVRMAESVP